MTTQEVIDKIFRDPAVKHELTEFEGMVDFTLSEANARTEIEIPD